MGSSEVERKERPLPPPPVFVWEHWVLQKSGTVLCQSFVSVDGQTDVSHVLHYSLLLHLNPLCSGTNLVNTVSSPGGSFSELSEGIMTSLVAKHTAQTRCGCSELGLLQKMPVTYFFCCLVFDFFNKKFRAKSPSESHCLSVCRSSFGSRFSSVQVHLFSPRFLLLLRFENWNADSLSMLTNCLNVVDCGWKLLAVCPHCTITFCRLHSSIPGRLWKPADLASFLRFTNSVKCWIIAAGKQ